MLPLDCSRQYEVLADYERRFGPLDYNGMALCYLVAQMLAAIEAIETLWIDRALRTPRRLTRPSLCGSRFRRAFVQHKT